MRAAVLSFAAPLLFAAPSSVAEPGNGQRSAWVERTPGGPTIVFLPQRSVPMFSSTVLVPAGSAQETEETNGAAHFLEHLLFNGTASRSREQIYARGDLLGAYNNASTQRERTVFQMLLPSEKWREGLELQADMLRNSTLPEAAFEKEKGIILEELAKDQSDPAYAAAQWESSILWGSDPRALPVLGTNASISAMKRSDVAAFYEKRYRSAGMTIVVMGDFDPEEARVEVARLYGSGGASPVSLPPRAEFPAGRSLHTRNFPQLESTELRILLPLPKLTGADHAGARLLAGWLGSGERSALHHAVEAAGMPAPDVSVDVDAGEPWSSLAIAATLPAETTDAQVAAVVDAILAHLTALDTHGVDGADRASVRQSFLSEELSLRERIHYYGMMRADVLATEPKAALHITDDLTAAEESARRLLKSALSDDRVLATAVGKKVTDSKSTISEDLNASLASWVTKPSTTGAPPLPPAPPTTSSTETRRVVLENGLVVVAHSSPDSRTFAAHLLLKDRARWESALNVPRGSSDVLHRMFANGTDRVGAHELRGLLASYGATVKVTDAAGLPYDDYYFTPEYSYVRAESFDVFAFATLEILGEIVLRPAFTADNLAQALESAITRAAEDAGAPRFVAETQFHAEATDLAGAVHGPGEELRRLDLASIRRVHDALTAPANMILTISSNLPPAVVIEAARRTFGTPRGETKPLAPRPAATTAAGRRVEAPTGRDQSWIVVGQPLDVSKDDEPALRLATAVLSERLAERLREKEGLAYSIGASLRLPKPAAWVTLAAGTRAQNLETMERGMMEVVASLRSNPPSDEEVEGARNRSEGRDRMRRLSRIGIAYALAIAELRGRDPVALDADLPALRAATASDVARAASRYLTLENPSVSIAR